MKATNTIEGIDIGMAVGIIRNDIGYENGQCLNENGAMASFLKVMNVDFTFEVGETVYIPFMNSYRIVHRDYRTGMKHDTPEPFHCWIAVGGKVLDIAIGSWTRHLPDAYKNEYIYGDYHNGFQLEKTFDYKELYNTDMPNRSHSYRKFSSPQRSLDLVFKYPRTYQPDMTMYDNLDFGYEITDNAQWYANQYRKKINKGTG